ncbi:MULTISPECIES: DUF4160 domain-containing protein [Rhodopseudomonas]|uniref:DUF4160 domain-containing protein n=1 Tax=Rhodopseudomonas TaxID=1073 RepID=UPI0009BC2416
MVSLDAKLTNCKICIYPGDHHPPHFHLRGPNSNALIDMVTLEVVIGRASRQDLDEARAWASQPEHLALLMSEWRRLNERD